MSLIQRSKKELVDLIHELQEKLKEVKQIETQVTTEAQELTTNGVGLVKSTDGYYSIVKLKFDVEKNAAVIDKVEKVETRDEAIVAYKVNQFMQEQIIRKARGGKYDK
jgi:hypothetical protein